MAEWKPIESAPQDGTEILLADAATETIWTDEWMATWKASDGTNGCWRQWPAFADVAVPTHWMPLPDPPTHKMRSPHLSYCTLHPDHEGKCGSALNHRSVVV